jgi:hypothetical protein
MCLVKPTGMYTGLGIAVPVVFSRSLSTSQALSCPLSLQLPLCLLIVFRSIDAMLLECQPESLVKNCHRSAEATALT